MNRAERRRHERESSRSRHLSAGPGLLWCYDPECVGDPETDWIICTNPGFDSCPDQENHRLEVMGAGMALQVRGGVPWDGPSTMDCGCVLTLRRYSEIRDEQAPSS